MQVTVSNSCRIFFNEYVGVQQHTPGFNKKESCILTSVNKMWSGGFVFPQVTQVFLKRSNNFLLNTTGSPLSLFVAAHSPQSIVEYLFLLVFFVSCSEVVLGYNSTYSLMFPCVLLLHWQWCHDILLEQQTTAALYSFFSFMSHTQRWGDIRAAEPFRLE